MAGGKAIGWTIVLAPAIASEPPVASFTSSCSFRTCTFDGSASSDGDGSIVQYQWNFGDGTTATGPVASRTYTANGTYDVTLTVVFDVTE